MNDKTVLEPLSTGDIIDRALKIYRQNFGAMLGIVAIPGLVTYSGSLLTLLGSSKMAMGGASTVNGGILIVLGYGIALLVGPLLNLLAIGGLSRTVADCVMLDQPIEFRQTLKMIQGRFGQLLAGQFLGMLIAGGLLMGLFMVAYFVLIFLFIILMMFKPTPGVIVSITIPLTLLLLAGMALGYCAVYARLVFIPCSIMIEGQTASTCISRSFTLGKGNTWKMLQIFLFDFAIAAAIVSALGIPLGIWGFFNGSFDDLANLPPWITIAYSTVDQLAKLLTVPIATIAYCLLYFDSRVRKEGYDVELIASRIGPPIPPPQPAWAPPQQVWGTPGMSTMPGMPMPNPWYPPGAYPTPPRRPPPPGSMLGL